MLSFAPALKTSTCLNLVITAAGRSPAQARCSHSNISQPDVYETNTKLIICFCKIYFSRMQTKGCSSFSRPGPGFQILASRSWLPNLGFHILATRSWLRDPDYQILPTTSWLPHPGYHILATTPWPPNLVYQILFTTFWLPDQAYQILAIRSDKPGPLMW